MYMMSCYVAKHNKAKLIGDERNLELDRKKEMLERKIKAK